jgi:hypothetical protein
VGLVCNRCGLVMCEPCPGMPAAYCAVATGGYSTCAEARPVP